MKAIADGASKLRAKDADFNLSSRFVQALTIAQLDKLRELDPWFKKEDNIVGAYFQKQHCEELSTENQEVLSQEEKL
jgi:carbamate kinase